jgi:hypothetical protein
MTAELCKEGIADTKRLSSISAIIVSVSLGFLGVRATSRCAFVHRAKIRKTQLSDCLQVAEESMTTSIAPEVEATHLIEAKHGMFASPA